jgi:hypothetical protein
MNDDNYSYNQHEINLIVNEAIAEIEHILTRHRRLILQLTELVDEDLYNKILEEVNFEEE